MKNQDAPGGNSSNNENQGNGTGHGSRQQTAGKRGEEQDKGNEEHYRRPDQKKQRGNHGGNH